MSDDEPGLAAIGAYAPRLRISVATVEEALGRFDASGIEHTAVPEANEDTLTMAVEACRRALGAGGFDGSDVAFLAYGTTTPPMEEEDVTPRLASMLGVPETAGTLSTTGSTRAGGQALSSTLADGPWADGVGLVVASDAPRGAPDSAVEHAAGAGAVAFVLAADGPARALARSSATDPYPGTRFRPAGDRKTNELGVTRYDRRAFTAPLASAADAIDADLGDVDAAAVQSPDGKLPYRATDALGVDAETIARAGTVSELGDTGAASSFFGVATAADDGADRVLLAAYGSGAGVTLVVFDGLTDVPVDAAVDGDGDLTYAEYLRRRGEITPSEPDGGGAYVSVPTWRRSIPQHHRLEAGRCPACDSLSLPPGGACPTCGERPEDYEPVELPGTGVIEAVTTIAQGGAPPEFVEQQARSGPFVSAIVALDGPAGEESVSVPSQVLTGPSEGAAIGDRIETTIRRIYEQEDVIRYGFMAQLADVRR